MMLTKTITCYTMSAYYYIAACLLRLCRRSGSSALLNGDFVGPPIWEYQPANNSKLNISY